MNTQINCGDSLDVNVITEITCDEQGVAGVGFRLDISTLKEEPDAMLTLNDMIRLREAIGQAIQNCERINLTHKETDENVQH